VTYLEGKPAVLLGVNSDADAAAARDTLASERLHFRSWCDGGTVRGGEISHNWNVQALPVTYVVDDSGIIRYRFGPRADGHDAANYVLDDRGAARNKWDMRAEQIRAAVDRLVGRIESARH
jgi:hypothetical protein